MITERTISKFWNHVEVNGSCWEWHGAKTHHGHGRFRYSRKREERAHRFSWMLENGDIPSGMLICHKCDNPCCVNPAHLFLGTPRDNMLDMVRKKRGKRPPYRYGEKHHNAKFSARDARKIAHDKRPAHIIAKEYGVSEKTIYRIRWGTSWIRNNLLIK